MCVAAAACAHRGASSAGGAATFGVASLTAPHTIAPSAPLAARADIVARVFRERGAHPLAERWTTFLRQNSAATVTVRMGAHACLGFAAVAREGIVDLNLTVSNAAGAVLAHDERTDAHPYVGRVCADAPTTWFVTMRAEQGNGEATMVTVVDPPAVAPALAQSLGDREGASLSGPRVQRAIVGRDPAVLSASALMSRVSARMTAAGYRSVGSVQSGAFARAPARARVALEGGRCYAVVGEGGDGSERVSMQVLAGERSAFGEDSGRDAPVIVRMCPETSGTFDVLMQSTPPVGSWAFGAFEIPVRPDNAEDLPSSELARLAELWSEASRRSMVPVGEPVRGHSAGTGEVSAAVTLREGRCYVIGAAMSDGEGPAALDVWLSGASGELLGADTLESQRATVFHCARATQRARVTVRAQGLRRTWTMQAFETRESP